MTAPFVIPVTAAPAQVVNVNLGGQDVTLNIYTKSINVPSQAGSSFVSNRLVGIAYGASLSGSTMAVSGSVTGLLAVGNAITGVGLASDSFITAMGPGTVGRLGSYTITPSVAVPTPVTRVTAYALISGQSGQLLVDPPPYENVNPVFIDVYLRGSLVVGGVMLRNRNAVIRNTYFGFVGDLAVIDTLGSSDPYGVPPTLPPVDLRNWWQRKVPLAFGGKSPPNVAGTIPGFGSRFLLTWWPSLR